MSSPITLYNLMVIYSLGFTGHICSLITFSSKQLRVTSTGLLFVCLGISDALYLSMTIYDFITITLHLPIMPSAYLCRFRTFIQNFSSITSTWLLVLISIDRFVGACFPYQQARACTRKKAWYSVAVICACSTMFTCRVLLSDFEYANVMMRFCGVPHSNPLFYAIFYFNTRSTLQLIVTSNLQTV
jgi:hypothetical protein